MSFRIARCGDRCALTFVLVRRLVDRVVPKKFGGDHVTVSRPVELLQDVAKQLLAFAVAECIARIEIEDSLGLRF